MKVFKNIRAYPVLRRKFFDYLDGVQTLPEGRTKRELFWDYLQVRRNHPGRRVSISEYFIFGFYALDREGQGRYLTDVEATLCMRPLNEEARPYLWDKAAFLRTFTDFVHRRWMFLPDATEEEFVRFASRYQSLALKPFSSSWGIGFERLCCDEVEDWHALYERLREGSYVAEEFLTSAPELSRFHPESLNTLRVITFYNGERFGVFGAGLRVGNNGKHVDNAHGGGIFCEIDPLTGVIVTDGLDEFGNTYLRHPLTGVPFRGEVIPRWQEVTALCRRACDTVPALRVVGWDVAMLADGKLELIEGNHNPGMNIVQAPAKHGVRDKFVAMCHEFFSDVTPEIRDASAAFGGNGQVPDCLKEKV
jgi:hypothetical protein